MIKNKSGSVTLYTIVGLFLIIVLMISFYALRLGTASKIKTDQTNDEIDFVNDYKSREDNLEQFESDTTNEFKEQFRGKEYTIEIKSTGNIQLEDVKDTYNLGWNKDKDGSVAINHANGKSTNTKAVPSSLTADSTTENQFLVYSGYNDNNFDNPDKVQKGIPTVLSLNSKLNSTKLPSEYINSESIVAVPNAVNARISVDSGNYIYIKDYPTNLTFPTDSKMEVGSLVTVEYLNDKHKVIGWTRYINSPTNPLNTVLEGKTYDSNRILLSKLPSANVNINEKFQDDIIFHEKDYLANQVGSNLNDIFPSTTSLFVGYGYEKACVTWKSKGLGFPGYASFNDTQMKSIMEYAKSPCEKVYNTSLLSNPLTDLQTNGNPWINGWNTLRKTDIDEIVAYWRKKLGASTPHSQIISSNLYCTDPAVETEVKARTQAFIDEVVKPSYNSAIAQYKAALDAWAAAGTNGPEPQWSTYEPKGSGGKTPAQTMWDSYPNKTNYTVPCISEYNRSSDLLQYEIDESVQTQYTLSFLNNYSSSYKVTIEGSLDILKTENADWNSYLIRNGEYYLIDKNDKSKGTDFAYTAGGTVKENFSLVFEESLPKNFNFVDLSLMYKNYNLSLDRNELRFAMENAVVNKITVDYTTVESEEFQVNLRNSKGELLYTTTKTIKNSM